MGEFNTKSGPKDKEKKTFEREMLFMKVEN